MENSSYLFPILDIAGVDGAFVLHQSGRLLGWNCKPAFGTELLQGAATRIATLFGALSEYLRPAQELTLVFDHYQLVVRARDQLMIAVLVEGETNQVALKLACNLALKRFQDSITGPPPAMRPATGSQRPPASGSVQPGPVPGKPKRSSGIWG
ncbi:MAG: hypothetical protein ACK4UN_09045 [Limisphaerales bacterium]